jgi:hypothetical protein
MHHTLKRSHFARAFAAWQAEYEREEIDWSYIQFVDNQDVLDLIEGKMGIFDLLDEVCRYVHALLSLAQQQPAHLLWRLQTPNCSPHSTWTMLPAHMQGPALCCSTRRFVEAKGKDFAEKLYGSGTCKDSVRFSKPKTSMTQVRTARWWWCLGHAACSCSVAVGVRRGAQRRSASVLACMGMRHARCSCVQRVQHVARALSSS